MDVSGVRRLHARLLVSALIVATATVGVAAAGPASAAGADGGAKPANGMGSEAARLPPTATATGAR
jgi:hypothetical protein